MEAVKIFKGIEYEPYKPSTQGNIQYIPLKPHFCIKKTGV